MNEQLKAAFGMSLALAEAIKELKSVPAGTLYAHVCGQMDLATFERVVGMLVSTGLVKRDQSHLLTWTGPSPCAWCEKEQGIVATPGTSHTVCERHKAEFLAGDPTLAQSVKEVV